MHWTYSALTSSGQEVSATVFGSRRDVLQQLSQQQLLVIELKANYQQFFTEVFSRKRLSMLSMAVFFEDFHNMLETGMSLPQALLLLKETSKDSCLVTMLSALEEQLAQGQSLTEALGNLKLFPWIVGVTLSAGEKTGRLSEAVNILGKYFRRSYQVQSKMQQAFVYPIIVFILLLTVMFFISFKVIPQLKSLLPSEAVYNQTTQGVLIFSFFLREYWWIFITGVAMVIFAIHFFRKNNRQRFEQWFYTWPLVGGVMKESALALYLLNLSILLKSGVALLKAMNDLNTFDKTPVAEHFNESREYMLGGASFWQSIEQDNFFPKIIASTLRRAEEMTKVDEYCLSLADFFRKRVDAKVDGLVHIIQPALLAIGGIFLVVIALAFLVPIYGSLTTIAGGN